MCISCVHWFSCLFYSLLTPALAHKVFVVSFLADVWTLLSSGITPVSHATGTCHQPMGITCVVIWYGGGGASCWCGWREGRHHWMWQLSGSAVMCMVLGSATAGWLIRITPMLIDFSWITFERFNRYYSTACKYTKFNLLMMYTLGFYWNVQ